MITIIYVLLVLEAANSGLWLAKILPTLAVRDWTNVVLILLRGGVSSLQIVGAVLLRTGRLSGVPIARASLAGSALLIPFEVGLRLVPTNADPTYRWWIVVGYWVYVAVAWVLLRGRGERRGWDAER